MSREKESYRDISEIRIARSTLEFYHRFISQPGARELLEEKKKELRKQGLI